MESVLVCFVSIALIIVSTVTMTMNTVNSAARLSGTWKDMQQKANSVRRTEIVSLPPGDYSGGTIDLTVKNEGQENISNFAHWDIIIAGPDGNARYLTYSASYPPGDGQWAVEGIYISDGVPEVFDLNILNPAEFVQAGLNPNGVIGEGQTIKVIVATAEGVTSQCFVTEQANEPPP
jgi:hypothetical protein